MKIIAFTGMPFSGKTEAINVVKKMNIPIIRMGDIVWEEVESKGLELNENNVGYVANEMRKKKGKEIWAKKTIKKIKSKNLIDTIIIDGVRSLEEVKYFKKILGDNFILISIDASDRLRYKRALMRNRKDDSKSIKSIIERDQREINWGLKSLIKSADISILNDSSKIELHKKIKKIIEKFTKKDILIN